MSTQITLPTGGTASLRDELVTERQNRLVEAANIAATGALTKINDTLKAAGISDEDRRDPANADAVNQAYRETPLTMAEGVSILELQDATIVAYLESWSLDRPLPTMDTIQDLDKKLYEALAHATRDRSGPTPHLDASEQLTPEGDLDKSAPFTDSSSSSAPTQDEPESLSTQDSGTSTESLPTEA